MQPPPASAEEIQQLLGEVDSFTIERILETHASVDEISEAVGDLEDERRFGDHHEPSNQRVNEVRIILEEIADEDQDEDYQPIGR